LPVAVGVEAALIAAIVYTRPGNALFATMPLPFVPWVNATLFAGALLVAEELRKWIIRDGQLFRLPKRR
jgi:hypothetical protein